MGISAWQLCSWPPYLWRIPDNFDQWPEFVHIHTSVTDHAAAGMEDVRHGDTVWVATIGAMTVGVGWEWIELRSGVFMLKDPNYVATNVRFLDDRLAPQGELDGIVSANRLVRALPWQATVSQVLAATRVMESAPNAGGRRLRPVRAAGFKRQSPDAWPAAAAA